MTTSPPAPSTPPAAATPVWFITGCSTGLGRALAQRVLAGGGRAAVCARRPADIAELVAPHADRALAVTLDLRDGGQIGAAVAAAEARFGRIDVLVNNAGYGYQTTIEEGDDAEIRNLFETNVFGLFALTRAVLKGMRERRSGYIINITSVAGYRGLPGSGYYAASKHAIEGWSDALHAEAAPLGIRVTCVAPGPFRTDWSGRSLRQTPNRVAGYEQTAVARMQRTGTLTGKQAGDPDRAAALMIELAALPAPPRSIVLGAQGNEAVATTLAAQAAEIAQWRERGSATDFPG
ncbi:MAG: oxidoreductase [Lautropia sp.]